MHRPTQSTVFGPARRRATALAAMLGLAAFGLPALAQTPPAGLPAVVVSPVALQALLREVPEAHLLLVL
jgi:hypothetical protein